MKNRSAIPDTPGVYMFLNANDEILYVGKAINLKKRVASYFKKDILHPRTKRMAAQIADIRTIQTASEFDALLLEAKLIKKHQPKYNVIWRDDKHPLYIKITGYPYPKVTTSRKEDEEKATYYGPFMSSTIVRDTLRFLREIVPFCTDRQIRKKPCFGAHIGLCAPCPNTIEQSAGKVKADLTREYKKNIRLLKKILDGKSTAVTKDLTKHMETLAKKEEYRTAAVLKKRLGKLEYLTRPRNSVKEYLHDPNLYHHIRHEELDNLAALLRITRIRRIEGYDISNIMGTHATGSMVVFQNGDPEKSQYRKFRIRRKKTPDDFAMMREVLERRVKRTEWPYPDVIVIDGGKGQVSIAVETLRAHNIAIPVLGIAKRLEEFILPEFVDGILAFRTKRLKKGSPALRLVQRIRDEAHRFAKTYHLTLRRKALPA